MYTENNIGTICNVSRETLHNLRIFHDTIIKWQKAVNLISPNTIQEIWHRHIADSIQLYQHIPKSTKKILDIGSGGGFPAIVCAILAKGDNTNMHFTMIESDMKKCLFLKECVRTMKLNATIINKRIEKCENNAYEIITARALADLNTLLSMAHTLTIQSCLFLKGRQWKNELQNAQQKWSLQYTAYDSITEKHSKILHITNYKKTP